MAVCEILIVVALVICVLAYWLWCPVYDGFSTQSTRTLRMHFAKMKLFYCLVNVGHSLGFGSTVQIDRNLASFVFESSKGTDPDVKETDFVFDGVRVRIFEPAGRVGILPGFVWYHGGGYVFGSLDRAADTTRRLCKQTNAVVVSVDYRLAPEHVFPAAFGDCVTATKYFLKNAAEFKVDPNRVAVGGDSAGGNLAAAVSLKMRDDSFTPAIKLQILVYPHLQSLDFKLPSMMQHADDPLLTRRAMAFFSTMYLEGHSDKEEQFYNNDHVSPEVKEKGFPFLDLSKLPEKFLRGYKKPNVDSGNDIVWNELKSKLLNPYFSPLAADRLDKLPPAYIYSVEFDPLRDEAFLYAARLRESGVKVTHSHSEIGFHGLVAYAKQIVEAEEAVKELTQYVVYNL